MYPFSRFKNAIPLIIVAGAIISASSIAWGHHRNRSILALVRMCLRCEELQ